MKKRQFRNGDIVLIKYNGHTALTRLMEVEGTLFPDKDTAIIHVGENSELPTDLPETFTESVEKNTILCDATRQFRYYKNLRNAYDVIRKNLEIAHEENKSIRKINDELASQIEELSNKLKEEKRKSIWERISSRL